MSDLISRQDAIDALDCINGVEEVLRSLPSAQKTGVWIEHEPFDSKHHNCNKCIECSNCHVWFGHDCYAKTNYCPNCGAYMKGKNE